MTHGVSVLFSIVSGNPDWPHNHYTAEDDFNFLIMGLHVAHTVSSILLIVVLSKEPGELFIISIGKRRERKGVS